MNVKARTAAFALLCALCWLSAGPLQAQPSQAAQPVPQAHHADRLMKDLGFRKSGHEYLYPIPLFRYACHTRQYRPYLAVPESSLEHCRSFSDSGKLAYLRSADLEWRILLPVTKDTQNRPFIGMKGGKVADDRHWHRLSPCLVLTTYGTAPLYNSVQEQALLKEADMAWKELTGWYDADRR